MLHLRYGLDWRALSDSVLNTVRDNAAAGVRGQILIVPEQISFDTEWRLCAVGGDRISRSAEVLSFTRLAGRVFSVTGGAAVRTLDRSGRLAAMAGALEQVRSRLKRYGRHIAKPEFLLQLLQLYDEFRSYGVDAAAIRGVWGSLSGSLAEKIEELSLIMESYEQICEGALQDPATRLDRLCDALETTSWAAGRTVFVDGFTDFTVQEERVLGLLAQGGAEVTVALCLDDPRRGQSLYAVCRDTAARLYRFAEQWGLGFTQTALPAAPPADALTYLQRNLFRAGPAVYSGPADAVCLSTAENPCEEVQNAVGEIQQLLASGAACRDIAVAYPDRTVYQPLVETLFARYRIPVYCAGSASVLKEPVVRCLLAALEAAALGMEPDPVMEYLRSGFAPADPDLADELENYALVWNLRGTLWERAFTLSPDGYRDKTDPDALAARLDRLNEGRVRALGPLIELKNDLAQAKTTAAQVQALLRFTDQIGLKTKLETLAAAAPDDKRAQEYAQLYELLLNVMEQIYGVLGRTVRTPEAFYRFFRAALSQSTVATIPAAVDCVHAGEYAAIRGRRPKYLLVLGAGEGVFPGGVATGSLLTDRDRRELIRADLPVAPDSAGQLERELLRLSLLLCAPTDRLLLSCVRERESYLFNRAISMLPKARRVCARVRPVTATQAAALLAALPEQTAAPADLRAAAEALRRRGDWKFTPLSPATVTALYGETVRLSATKIDKYASCKLAFFLDFGLAAKELRPASVDAPLFGEFVHYVLEHTVRDVEAAGGFRAATLEQTRTLARTHIEAYAAENLGGLEERSRRAAVLFERSLREVEGVVDELWAELRVSDFRPERCEMKFEEILTTPQNHACQIVGYVDRVDLYRPAQGPAYLRVVDYKTGRKTFDLTDVQNGMGLQMLIYLFALEDRGRAEFGTAVKPAGVLYFPARIEIAAETEKPSPEDAAQLRQKQFVRKGMLLRDDAILDAMEHVSGPPRFLPYKIDRAGDRSGNLATAEQFGLLRRHVREAVTGMTDQIMAGTVAPNPYARDKAHSACTWCPYRAVCHVLGGGVPLRRLAKTEWAEFMDQLERKEAQHRGDV